MRLSPSRQGHPLGGDDGTNDEARDVVINAMQVDIDDMNALGLLQDTVIDAMQVDVDDMNALRIIENGVLNTHAVDMNTNDIARDVHLTDVNTIIEVILADTAELQTDWTDGGRLDLIIDGVTAAETSIWTNTNE